MSRSANEVASLAQKAARGAGFPPAQAERFGHAVVRHLAAHGTSEAVRAALSDTGDSPILRLPLLLEDVQRAIALAGPEVALTLHPGDEDLAVAYAGLLPMTVLSCAVEVPEEGQARLHLTVSPDTARGPDLPARITVDDALWAALSDLARHSYVPASAGSRAAGAGAGDIDND